MTTIIQHREIILQMWSDERNDSVTVGRLTMPLSDDVPWTLEHEGHTYQQGQWSGQQGLRIWFDRQEV